MPYLFHDNLEADNGAQLVGFTYPAYATVGDIPADLQRTSSLVWVGSSPRFWDGATWAEPSAGGGHLVSVTDFGAAGDGVTDDSAAVLAAIQNSDGKGVFFPPGTYLMSVTVPQQTQVDLWGVPGLSVLKLPPTETSIVHTVDVAHLRLNGLKLDADSAVGTGGLTNIALVLLETTVATQGDSNFTLDASHCHFVGNTGAGQGHVRASVHENTGSTFSVLDRFTVTNCRFESTGQGGPAVSVRGPARAAKVDSCTFRNDGVYGLQTYGSGISHTSVSFSCEVSFGHQIEHVEITNCESFRTAGLVFTQQVRSLTSEGNTTTESCVNPTLDSAADTFTVDIGADTITPAGGVPAGYGVGSVVEVTGADLPAPLVSGNLYTVRTVAPIQLETFGGAASAIDLTTAGSGTFNITWKGMDYSAYSKGDDNEAAGPFAGGEIRHLWKNCRWVRSSPRTGGANLAYERNQTRLADQGEIIVEGCDFDDVVRISAIGGDAQGPHFTFRDSAFRTHDWNAAIGSASPLSLPRGLVDNCSFQTSPSVSPGGGVVTYSNCSFGAGLTINPASQETVVRVLDNQFGTLGGAVNLDVSGPSTPGDAVRVELRGNRRTGATPIELRLFDSTNASDLAVTARDDDFVLSSFGDTQNPSIFQYTNLNAAATATGSFTGDGTTTVFALAHNLGLGNSVPQITFHNTTTNEVNPPGGPALAWTDGNTVTATFTTAPTTGHVYEWRAV